MPTKLTELVAGANELLQPQLFNDYCPNGLQVQGKSDVTRLISGVTASQALIDQAIDLGADAILVHHGFFWKGENPCVTGMKHRRLKALLTNDISLLAYHLPLDAHPRYGNNAQLAKVLGIDITGDLAPDKPGSVGNIGALQAPLAAYQFKQEVSRNLGREALLVDGGEHLIKTIALCTGGAQGYIDLAVEQGVDAYLSGEISEPTVHTARESGIHYIGAGHHATERYGVQAVGRYLAQLFTLDHQFVDIDNPA